MKNREPTITLFRPVGQAELDLIKQSGWQKFPPRLPGQPIFYPVLNEEYAIEIAKNWNAKYEGVGYVLEFYVYEKFLKNYPVHTVGSSRHKEYWIPAEDLEELNNNLHGRKEKIFDILKFCIWHIYIVECTDGTLYTGITNNLEKRINQHNSGRGAKYTRGRGPVRLIRSFKRLTKSDALKLEYKLKKLSKEDKLKYSE